jgi:hypothetical protein
LKVFTAGVAAAATGVAALGTAAVKSYADFEQLTGGAQLMFGDAYDYIADKAENAYKTVQLSQNEYLTQVNGFATGLKTALGGNAQAAAELADRIITAEADIVAATGNTAENVQNAFNGIMKSNFTMLDNLQIGITPTKEGMQEVIDKVNEWNAAQGNATAYTITNVADCQSAVIDYIEMVGMAGYAGAEASQTLSGSIASMSAAWDNLLMGMADDNAELDELVNNFIDSVGVVAENLVPRVEIALEGVGSLIEELLPIIVARIPEIVDEVLPSLFESGAEMVVVICSGIVDTLPVLGKTAYDLVEKMLTSITENADSVFLGGSELIYDLIQGITDKIPELLSLMVDTIIALAWAITEPDVLINLSSAGIELTLALAEGLADAVPELLEAAPEIIARLVLALIANAPRLLFASAKIIYELARGLIESLGELHGIGVEVFDELIDSFCDVEWSEIGSNILDGIWKGLKNWSWLTKKVKNLANNLFDAACDALEIHSPSRKFAWVADMCIAGMDEPLEDYNPYETLQDSMKANISGLQASFAKASFAIAGGPAMDYTAMGDELRGAISGLGVFMNGERVGELVTPTVNSELADCADRRI